MGDQSPKDWSVFQLGDTTPFESSDDDMSADSEEDHVRPGALSFSREFHPDLVRTPSPSPRDNRSWMGAQPSEMLAPPRSHATLAPALCLGRASVAEVASARTPSPSPRYQWRQEAQQCPAPSRLAGRPAPVVTLDLFEALGLPVSPCRGAGTGLPPVAPPPQSPILPLSARSSLSLQDVPCIPILPRCEAEFSQ